MKTKFRIIPVMLALAMVIGLNSCNKKTDDPAANGKLKFSVAVSEDLSTLKSGLQDSTIYDTVPNTSYQLLLSVADMNGVYVFEDKLIPLYRFGSGFVSEQLEIKAGEYYLKKFMVINNYGKVIYASPVEGSPRAYLVNHPLPIYFTVNPNETTQLAPEVLPVDGYNPSDFGYATFMVQVVKPWPFYVMAMLDNDLLERPTLITDAILYVYTPGGWSHDFKLEPMVNKLEVRSSEYYEMVVYKEGFPEVRLKLTGREILSTSEDNPYIIKIGTQPPYHTLYLQPGPEDGMDARITNLEPDKNFGDYKYFETTFMSEPILTVMRSTQSLIYFNLGQLPKSATIQSVFLTLYYDLPIYWEKDSLYYSHNGDAFMPIQYGAVLQQIIEPWKEYGVTWNNQPKSTEISQVMIYPFIKNANFITVDVTSIYVPNPYIDSLPLPNYGMMFKLLPNESFPGFRFASSDYPEPYMRPSLAINYTLPEYNADGTRN